MLNVKYFVNGYVESKEVESLEKITQKIIRVIPENHKKFNIKDQEYAELNKNNIKFLSVGDMVIIHDFNCNTYWHEITFNEELNSLCYSGNIQVENLLSSRHKKVDIRNDFYIPEYARFRI